MPGSTTVTQLTPTGRGAIATLALHGPLANACITKCFRPLSPVAHHGFLVGKIYVGVWHGGAPEECGEELVVCRTAENCFEIHCHGGQVAVDNIIAALAACECVSQPWASAATTQQPAWKRHALQALTQATTERTALILLDQFHGALDHAIAEVIDAMAGGEHAAATGQLQALCDRAAIGRRLTAPWSIVIAGPPNVGKSSLLNALLGYHRAVVFDQPGTTRDVVAAQTAIDGWPVQLADTAGLRDSSNPLEADGIARTRSQMATADLVIAVASVEKHSSWPASATVDSDALRVVNKVDLVARLPEPPDAEAIYVSARTHAGIDQLIAAISHRLVPTPPPTAAAVPLLAEQQVGLQAALIALANGDLATARDELLRLR